MKWEKSELDCLTEYYSKKGPVFLSNLLNRKKSTIISKAHSLGLKFNIYDIYDYRIYQFL
jgi:hypothetical protein